MPAYLMRDHLIEFVKAVRPRPLLRVAAAVLLCLPAGCLRVAPKMPPTLASPAPIAYSGKEFDADVTAYRGAVQAGDVAGARQRRDTIVYRVLAQVDAAYGAFEVNLDVRRAGAQTAGDAAQLGVTAAATVVGASGVKDILTATATALEGTRLSFDKNYFEQKTTEALVSQMRASRSGMKAQLLSNLGHRDVASYPLEAAWVDLIGYYYAGTIPAALVEIANHAGSDAVKADQDLKDTVRTLTPATPAQARQAVDIRAVYEQLQDEAASNAPGTALRAMRRLRAILTGAAVSFDPRASSSDLLARMREAMVVAAEDPAKEAKLEAAVQAAMEAR